MINDMNHVENSEEHKIQEVASGGIVKAEDSAVAQRVRPADATRQRNDALEGLVLKHVLGVSGPGKRQQLKRLRKSWSEKARAAGVRHDEHCRLYGVAAPRHEKWECGNNILCPMCHARRVQKLLQVTGIYYLVGGFTTKPLAETEEGRKRDNDSFLEDQREAKHLESFVGSWRTGTVVDGVPHEAHGLFFGSKTWAGALQVEVAVAGLFGAARPWHIGNLSTGAKVKDLLSAITWDRIASASPSTLQALAEMRPRLHLPRRGV